jgi:heptose I phosphotransferase
MAFIEINPRYREFLEEHGLARVEQFLALPGAIFCGHPDRNIARVRIGVGPAALSAFLKREHTVTWGTRLTNAWAGFGLVSRSLREARLLSALYRAGVTAPDWIAAGEEDGRAFLLVRELPGVLELRSFLQSAEGQAPQARRRLARELGAALAHMHEAGFEQPDLYSKHVLVDGGTGRVAVVDWPRGRQRDYVSWSLRCRDLAALHATLADELAPLRDRLACLHAYLHAASLPSATLRERQALRPLRAAALREIAARARRLKRHRHIRELRQTTTPAEPPSVFCLDGEALCVTAQAPTEWRDRAPAWLATKNSFMERRVERAVVAVPGTATATLVRRRTNWPLAWIWSWLWGHKPTTQEIRQAGLIFRLQRYQIETPRLLAFGQRHFPPWRTESLLLTEWPAGAVRLTDWLAAPNQRAHTEQRRRVLRQAGALVRRLHDAGCQIASPSARKRSIVCPLAVKFGTDGVPVVSLGTIAEIGARRQRGAWRQHRELGLLLDQLSALGCTRTDRLRFLLGYIGERRLDQPQRRVGRLLVCRKIEVGSLFSGAEFLSFWQRLRRGVRRLRQEPDWEPMVGPHWAEGIMDVAVTDRFHAKQGRSTGRWIIENAGRHLAVYLKRHYRLRWWQGLLALVWPGRGWSPAFQEWDRLAWARAQGLPVPRTVAACETIGPWGRLQSFLAVEELADMLPLHEAIPAAERCLAPVVFQCWKRSLAIELARLSRELHSRRRFHKDLYLCHFFIHREDTQRLPCWRGQVHMIDFHRLGHHPLTWPLWQAKDLAQLLYSSDLPGVTARDRLTYWRSYFGASRHSWFTRWLRQAILWKAGLYQRHGERRRARSERSRRGESKAA